MDNQPKVESDISSQNFNVKEQFTTVTPLSKYAAMVLFVILPFVGFYLGRTYIPSAVDVVTIQTSESADIIKTVPADNQVNEVVTQSTTTSALGIKLAFSREAIKLGNVIKIAENQIRGSGETDSTLRDYTLTSVRQISIPDKKVEHAIFQACYLDTGTYIDTTCEVLALNTNGQLISLLDPRSYSSHIYHPGADVQKLYQEYMEGMIKKDLLNNESDTDELFIRPGSYPYLYLTVSCADATFRGGCSLYGFDIDTDFVKSSYVELSNEDGGTISSPEFSENIEDPTAYYNSAGKNVNGKYVRVSLNVWIESLQSKEKIVTVIIFTGAKGGEEDTLLKLTIPVEEKTNLEYDFRNQSNEASITIGAKEYTFDFTNSTLKEII